MKLLVSLILASVIRLYQSAFQRITLQAHLTDWSAIQSYTAERGLVLGLGSGRSAAWPKVIFVPVRQTNTDRSGCLMLLLLAVVGLLVGQLLLASFGR